jgi:agmatine deiminase
MVRAIAEEETACVLAGGAALAAARAALGSTANVELVDIPTNDAWTRDYAPTFVVNRQSGRLAAIDWQYNAWGGKYPPFEDDQRVAARIAERLGLERFEMPATIEGGALEINARGELLTTRSCLLDPHRNPESDEASLARLLQSACAARKVIWLPGDAIIGDDTDGHIDQLARWTDDRTIVYAWSNDAHDAQRPALEANRDALRDAFGATVDLVALPLPGPVYFDDQRLPASYTNFYVTNGAILVPEFGDARADDTAAGILAELFPSRRTIRLASRNLSVGLGSFHCLTQQQPATQSEIVGS